MGLGYFCVVLARINLEGVKCGPMGGLSNLWKRSLVRYTLTGTAMSVAMYGGYALLETSGLSPQWAISIVYPLAVIASYVINRRFTFGSNRAHTTASWRFILAHSTGYVLNVSLLTVFATLFGFPHLIVEAIVIVVVGLSLYALMRFFVFPSESGE